MALRLSGLVSNMDTDSIVKELMSAQSLKRTKLENIKTTTNWKQEQWKELNTKIYALYTGSISQMRLQGSYGTQKVSSTDETAVTATANSNAALGSHKVSVSKLASAQYITGGSVLPPSDPDITKVDSKTNLRDLGMAVGEEITVATADGKTKTITIEDDTTIGDFVSSLQSAGLNAGFDEKQGRFFLSSKKSGVENAFTITATGDMSALGLEESQRETVAAQNAEFMLNGANLTSSTNKFTVNGLTLELKEETTNAVTLNVNKDTDAVYNMVKDFVKGYNELIGEMNDSYYATTAKGYAPLTDEQKEAMTEDQIEKWENKIKDSLLRRDDTLGGLLSAMKSTLSNSVSVDGKKYSLASFGISSVDYTEKGKLHIYGDAEDALTAGNQDKLKKAINDDPDTVMKVLTSLADDLHSTLQDKMKSSSLSSALTFYNDKEMKSSITKYEKDLKALDKKLAKIENNYYKQFSAMEKAMSKLNSQQSSLASML